MKKIKKKRIKSGEERILMFELFHNGLYKQKIIPNKKKVTKKYNWKKDVADYTNTGILVLI